MIELIRTTLNLISMVVKMMTTIYIQVKVWVKKIIKTKMTHLT